MSGQKDIKAKNIKIISVNRRANFNYSILDTYEAGIVLTGGEVKSLRDGKVNIGDSFGRVEGDEIFLFNMHINPYFFDMHKDIDPLRTRKLLFHRQEITRLMGKMAQQGLTLVPLKIYFKSGKVKVELGLGKGKKAHDKRETLKKKAADMEVDRTMKGRR